MFPERLYCTGRENRGLVDARQGPSDQAISLYLLSSSSFLPPSLHPSPSSHPPSPSEGRGEVEQSLSETGLV